MTLPELTHRRHNDKPPVILPREATVASGQVPPAAQPRNRKLERGRKNVSRACQLCRQRRIRCTTEKPCRPCQVNGVDCIGDGDFEAIDLRTIRPGPQNQKAFIQQRKLLDNLIRSIRTDTADDVIKCIKDGGSLNQIAQALGTGGDDSPCSDQEAEDVSRNNENEISPTISYQAQNAIDRPDPQHLQNFGNLPMSSAFKTNGFSNTIQEQQIAHLSSPIWECSPLISDDDSLTDLFSLSCYSFRELAKEQLTSGLPPELVLSLDGIEMDLLFRNRRPDDPHTVSTWACELLKTFDFLHPVVKLASAEAVGSLMRWLIAPTKENYLALPPGSVPLDAQFFVPHSIGIDVMMVPEIRDALLVRRSAQAWTSIVTPRTMDFNWPYSVDACLELVRVGISQQGTCMRLSKAFTEHIHCPDNMSLDYRVLTAFPEFEGKFRWHSSDIDPTLAKSGERIAVTQVEVMTDGSGS